MRTVLTILRPEAPSPGTLIPGIRASLSPRMQARVPRALP